MLWHILMSKKINIIYLYCLAWIEGFAIFLAVFIVVFVGSYNDYKKEDQFFKLYALDQEGKYVSVPNSTPLIPHPCLPPMKDSDLTQ